MATISEDYVSFETAKLLKEKGFDEITFTWYNGKGKFCVGENNFDDYHMNHFSNMATEKHKNKCSAPTLQMAMKWLREVHGLHISLEPCYDYDSMHVIFLAFIQNVADVHEFMDGRKNVASYPNAEKCYELALKYCLENLI